MRKATLRLKAQQLLERARAAQSFKQLLAIVEVYANDIIKDKRRKVTAEIAERVIAAADEGVRMIDMVAKFGLAAPTLRRIIRKADAKADKKAYRERVRPT